MTKRLLIITLLVVSVLSLSGRNSRQSFIPNDSIAFTVQAADTLITDSVQTDTIDNARGLTVQQRIANLLDDKLFRTTQVGIMVYDLTADTLIYACNEQQTMRPASTMKLTTAITALDRLGGSYRYSTSLKYKGALYDASQPGSDLRKNVLVGNVIAVGGMDPRFGSDDMNAFVEALQKEHIDTIYGEIQEDRSFKDGNLLGEGWCWDDKNPVLTPLLWNRKDQFAYKLTQMIRDAGIVVRPHDAIPCDSLGNRLYVVGKDSVSTLATRYHSIDQILVKMMKDSDNLYAETMFYQIAASATRGRRPGSAKDAADIINALYRKLGYDPSDYRVADGSGLSLYNYQSAELQVSLLRYAYDNTNIFEHLYPSLPVAGYDGTLKRRMTNSLSRGNVHAKTGTLTGVSSLSGYATAANGNMLCFAIINQGILSSSLAKTFQDRVCNILCTYE